MVDISSDILLFVIIEVKISSSEDSEIELLFSDVVELDVACFSTSVEVNAISSSICVKEWDCSLFVLL